MLIFCNIFCNISAKKPSENVNKQLPLDHDIVWKMPERKFYFL